MPVSRRSRMSLRRLLAMRWLDHGEWRRRLVVMAAAVAAGLSVVALDLLGDRALALFHRLTLQGRWLPLLWMPVATVLILWLTRRYAPMAAGSGIPQVLSVLDHRMSDAERPGFVSLRVSAAKLVLTSLGLLAGLSVGREGPSVQVAAGVMHSARGWLPGARARDRHALLVAGGAAGIAAAFNAPLAGVMFAIEELSRSQEQRNSGLLVMAIVLAGLVGVAVQGHGSYFGVIHAREIGWSGLPLALGISVTAAVAGGLFARLMVIAGGDGHGSPVLAWRRRHPYRFAIACAMALALIGTLSDGATFGSGYQMTSAALQGQSLPVPGLAFLKFVATWLTTLCGVPGGIFAPSLAIGSALGDSLAALAGVGTHVPFIAIGMTAFLAGVTQAPMTSFIVVMEMVDDHQMIFSLMAAAMIASALSSRVSPALYPALSRSQLRALRRRVQGPVPGPADHTPDDTAGNA